MEKLLPTLLLALLCLLIFWLMRAGWVSRQKRQEGTGDLTPVPERYENAESSLAVPGTYVATTVMGDWLDRIATNTLGVKANGTFFIFEDAAVIARDGAEDIWIPASEIIAVRTEAGMTGKFVEKNGLIIVSWNLNSTKVDTGFRTRFAADKASLVTALSLIAPQALDALPKTPVTTHP
ncbi:MAG: hypothetical protein Q3965_05165 [Rothia sp. (in: high G+C Gram-positive bacteria)]|nr:hypothetical protein [Rothia sp. (in: high G+C Gram-positive bacteria)]